MLKPSNYAPLLRSAREAAGLRQEQVAAAAGIELASYLDLESHDDEIRMGVSAREAARVLRVLNLSPFDLFVEPNRRGGESGPAPYAELARAIQEHLRHHGLSTEHFEEKVGWEVRQALRDPERFGDLTLDALSDVSDSVGVEWRRLLFGAPAPT